MEKIKHIGAVLVVIISAPFKFISWCCEEERIYTIKDVLFSILLGMCIIKGIIDNHMLSSTGSFIANVVIIAITMIILNIPFMIVYILKTFINLIFSKRFNTKFTLMLNLALYPFIYYFLFKLLSNIKTRKDIEIWTFGISVLMFLYAISTYLEDQKGKKKDKDRLKEKQLL